jgi:hypothetical protein
MTCYMTKLYVECHNQRNSLYLKHIFEKEEKSTLSDNCWWHMWCALGLSCLYESANVTSVCREGIYRNAGYCQTNKNLHLSCPKLFFFPPTSFILPFVQLLYQREEYSPNEYSYFKEPMAVCYNKSLCDIYSSLDMELPSFKDYICLELEEFQKGKLLTDRTGVVALIQLATIVHAMFSHCTVQSVRGNSSFQCSTHFLISPHRLFDGYSDCLPDSVDDARLSLPCQLNLTDRFECSLDHGLYEKCIPRRFLLSSYRDLSFWDLLGFFNNSSYILK